MILICVLVNLDLGACFKKEAFCRAACARGKGGLLCACNAVHFAGKRNSAFRAPTYEGQNQAATAQQQQVFNADRLQIDEDNDDRQRTTLSTTGSRITQRPTLRGRTPLTDQDDIPWDKERQLETELVDDLNR